MDHPTPSEIAEFDQTQARVKTEALLTATFFVTLVMAGLEREEALELTQDYLGMPWANQEE